MTAPTLYHVVVINEKTRQKIYMTATPTSHHAARVILSKITRHPWRRETIEPADQQEPTT